MLQYSVPVRNAKLDAIEAKIGPNAILKIFSGAQSANCAAPDPSGLLATLTLPPKWMAGAELGSKAKNGTWSANASGAGIAASWRIYAANGTTCGIQGNAADMVFDDPNIAIGQPITVIGFTLTDGNG